MIDSYAFDVLSVESLKKLSELVDTFDCPDVPCYRCPFALDVPYNILDCGVYRCAFGYANLLYRRLTK